MYFGKDYLLLGLPALNVLLFVGFINVDPDRLQTDFWKMEGTRIAHHFEDKADSLSPPEFFELQDENGLPVWFGRHFFKDVCLTGTCKMIRLALFWDGAGNYLGMNIPEGEPLTKSDHTKFAAADYVKLEGILRDTSSILKDLKSEDLIIIPKSSDPHKAYNVDGYTGATQPALSEVVVKDAVYTCHTLWHTVYGPTSKEILDLLQSRVNEKYLSLMFASQNPKYKLWAIQSVESHPAYHNNFYAQIINCIKSKDIVLANKALSYFGSTKLADTIIQNQLVQIVPDVDMNFRYEILWKLIGVKKVNGQVVLKLLKMFESKTLGLGTLHLIFRLISTEHLNNNQEIIQLVNSLSEYENTYIRNLSGKLLKEKTKPHAK